MNPPEYISPQDFEAATGLSLSSIYRRIKDGSIHAVRLGSRYLIPADELTQLAERSRANSNKTTRSDAE
jgi:excisionase family DNA binding protein